MRDLTASEMDVLAAFMENMTSEEFESYIRIASASAARYMRRLGKNLVDGKGGDDYAIEGFVYIASRGQSMSFLSRRTQLMVLDGHRREDGRNGQHRLKKVSLDSVKSIPSRAESNFDDLLSDLPEQFGIICKALLDGYSKTEAAKMAKICPTKLRDMASKQAWRITC